MALLYETLCFCNRIPSPLWLPHTGCLQMTVRTLGLEPQASNQHLSTQRLTKRLEICSSLWHVRAIQTKDDSPGRLPAYSEVHEYSVGYFGTPSVCPCPAGPACSRYCCGVSRTLITLSRSSSPLQILVLKYLSVMLDHMQAADPEPWPYHVCGTLHCSKLTLTETPGSPSVHKKMKGDRRLAHRVTPPRLDNAAAARMACRFVMLLPKSASEPLSTTDCDSARARKGMRLLHG